MPYELYKRTTSRADIPTVSITAGGRIAVNAAAAKLLMQTQARSAELLWDATKNRLAIRVAAKGSDNSFALTFNNKHAGATMAAMNFLRHIRWNGLKRESVRAEWNAARKMLEATLPAEFIGPASAIGGALKPTTTRVSKREG